jgi:hypothetical protein
MSRFDISAHRNEMDRMSRQRRRQFAIVQFLVALTFIASVGAVVWLIANPEQVGAFFGRIAAGFGSEVHRG